MLAETVEDDATDTKDVESDAEEMDELKSLLYVKDQRRRDGDGAGVRHDGLQLDKG